MATFIVDERSQPQRQAPIQTGAPNTSLLSGLMAMERARVQDAQREKYYDYLNQTLEQRLNATKAKDREEAIQQKANNKKYENDFDKEYDSLSKVRESFISNVDYLDREIGPGRYVGKTLEQIKEERARLTEDPKDSGFLATPFIQVDPRDTAQRRIQIYKQFINSKEFDSLKETFPGMQLWNRLRVAMEQADAAIDADATIVKNIKSIPGVRMFTNQSGDVDYEFVPQRDQIKYFKIQHKENPFTRQGIQSGTADEADAATFGATEPTSPKTLPGGPLIAAQPQQASVPITSDEYVTPMGAQPQQASPLAGVQPQALGYLGVQPQGGRPPITSDEYITPLNRQSAPPQLMEMTNNIPESAPASVRPDLGKYQAIADRNAFGLQADVGYTYEAPPEVEGNRRMRLDQMRPPAENFNDIPVAPPSIDSFEKAMFEEEKAQDAQALPVVEGNRPMRLDQMRPPAEDFNYIPSTPSNSGGGDYTYEDFLRDNPSWVEPPPASPSTLMEMGSVPRQPLMDRSFPEMGPVQQATSDPVILDTFGEDTAVTRFLPYYNTAMETPLMRSDGSRPTREELLGLPPAFQAPIPTTSFYPDVEYTD